LNYSEVLAKLRKDNGYTQLEAANFICEHSGKAYNVKNISGWENGKAMPPIEQFLLLCEFYGVRDIQETFRGEAAISRDDVQKLNSLGKSRVKEYIAMLLENTLFREAVADEDSRQSRRYIKLYNIPVAAGFGEFLDSDDYEDFEVDETVPDEADFAVRVSGDSMLPRFVDGQIVFIREQQTLDIGDIGIFLLNGDAFIKRLGQAELISLNKKYDPIELGEFDSLRVFGKVVG
jgi:phage repressor protein C with HTH and peptisase S24 domain